MGSPASRGSAQLLLFLFACLQLSGAISPAPAPDAPVADASSPPPAPAPVAPVPDASSPPPAPDASSPPPPPAPAPAPAPGAPVADASSPPPPSDPVADASPFSFNFDFSNASSYRIEDLKLEGNATVHDNLVDVTCNSFGENPTHCTGRVSYAHPVPFYDSTTDEVASFQTRFTFAIMLELESKSKTVKGDGMAFFLAYYPSAMPPHSGGGNLGLLPSGDDGKSMTAFGNDRFVAVEFDTFNNSWDPDNTVDHIGIDISSMSSVNTTNLTSFSLNGSMTATITFDNTTRMLVADLQFHGSNTPRPVQVSTQLPYPVNTLLPPQVAVGFSAATGNEMELHQILSWSFNSSLAPPRKGHDMKTAIIGGSIGGAMALVLVVWCVLSCVKWRKSSTTHDFVTLTGGPRQYEYRDLAVATDNFSKERVIGRGAFGVVYRGTLISRGSSTGALSRESCASSSEVAVKKILNEQRGGNRDFFAEMTTISAAKHKNLVKLKGWCCRENSRNMLDFMCWCCRKKDNELFLVYELVPNGNLHYHLRESEKVVAWPTRYQLVKDIGSALVYLHHDCTPYILHRDIKPSNILLDNNFNAKLADFGLSRIGNQDNATLLTIAIGTEGYIDPECRKDGKVKFYRSSDVYSFGIVLLDIVCTGKSREQVWELYIRGRVMEATDGRLHGGDDDLDRNQMQRVAVLGLWCSLSESAKRPTVRKAMEVLERDEPLPDLDYLVKTSVPSAQQGTCTISSDQHALKSDGT